MLLALPQSVLNCTQNPFVRALTSFIEISRASIISSACTVNSCLLEMKFVSRNYRKPCSKPSRKVSLLFELLLPAQLEMELILCYLRYQNIFKTYYRSRVFKTLSRVCKSQQKCFAGSHVFYVVKCSLREKQCRLNEIWHFTQ